MLTAPASALVSAVLIALAALLSACAPAGAADVAPPTISATGTGRISVRPDTAFVTVGAEARAATLAAATADVSRRMTEVVARAKAAGVQEADITTVTYAVEPIVAPRRSEDEGTKIIAYRATNVARLRLRALDAAGRVLDEVVAAGANVVRGVQFTVADPGPAEARARAEAVRDARERAQQLAAAAGVKLVELLWLGEGQGPRPFPEPVYRQTMATSAGPIEPGQMEIIVTVEARWRVAP